MVIYYIEHVYLMPYIYSFSQLFQALRLLAALRLFQTLDSRVISQADLLRFFSFKHKCSWTYNIIQMQMRFEKVLIPIVLRNRPE